MVGNLDSASNEKVKAVAAKLYDSNFRQLARRSPQVAATELGYQLHDGSKVIVCENSHEKMYLVIIPMVSVDLSDQQLENLQAAGMASTISTAGTVGTATLSVSTVSSAATAGSLL